MEIEYSSLKNEAEKYWKWSRARKEKKVPIEVANQGAGSEIRTPLMHYGAVLPVYLAAIRYIKTLKKKKIKILELGCGTGRLLAFLKSEIPGSNILGTDFTIECIDYAKKHYEEDGLRFLTTNAKNTFLKMESFDVVISSHVIEHLNKNDGRKFLIEAKKLIRKGGMIIIGTPERKWCQGVYGENPEEKASKRLIIPHLHEYTKEEIKKLAYEVFGKDNFRVDLLKNKLFKKIFVSGVEKVKPGKWTNKYFRWIRDNTPRNVFDKVTKFGNRLNIFLGKTSYKEILFENRIIKDGGGVESENLLLVGKK
jgi:2-polyprenyl-3-methyl-5-hydroxy-6-metoxy-1,4-benzoquinol methylase